MEKTNLLVVSQNIETFEPLKKEIDTNEFEVILLNNLDKTIQITRKNNPEIIIIDYCGHKDDENFDIINKIKIVDPQIEVIVIGENPLSEEGVEAINLGAYDYINKPLDFEDLADTIVSIHRKKINRKEIGELENQLTNKYKFQGMYGKSPQMLEVFSFLRRISKHPTTVLITGETGTGKELVARAIHNLSQRKKSKYVSCNCSALSESLLESELFGHVKGAFTGAHQTKHGLFEYGNNGTIFLDEIGDISQLTQTKLLRVLESREIQRVGSNENIKIDVRLISATNKELEEDVNNKTFRKDLYYRLNVAHICLPPLRERKEDIPLLCSFFIRKFNESYGKKVKGISQPAKLALSNHNWPGNVRELEHVIERAMSLISKDFISNNDLPPAVFKTDKKISNNQSTNELYEEDITLEELEKKYIKKILHKSRGNKVKTAKLLGLSRRSLYRKLEKYNIE